jgi:hypothetical protein
MPTADRTMPVTRSKRLRATSTSVQGRASAMCSGRATRFGTRPTKTRPMWKAIVSAPRRTQNAPGEVSSAWLVPSVMRALRDSAMASGIPRCAHRDG